MKRIFAILLAALMLLTVLAACGGNNPGDPNNPNNPKPEATEDGGMTYADTAYFPVVKEPISLEAAIYVNVTNGDYPIKSMWKEIAEKTGVTFDLRLIAPSGDTAALLFASRDYPDVSFRLNNEDILIAEACQAGDIIELTDTMMEKFAPNYTKLLNEYPNVKRVAVHADGKLYGLPNVWMNEDTYMLRDVNAINGDWLDELGLAMPTTLDEFTAYLRAVKAAAGTGSIPSNVTPLFIRHFTNIGGWWSICDWFGLYQGLNCDIVVDDTTVVSNAQNEQLKRPIKYLASLYSEGLIDANFNSAQVGGWDSFVAATTPENGQLSIGAYFAYDNNVESARCFAPLKVDDATPSYSRDMGFEDRVIKDAYFIFANCKYPVAALRVMDAYGTTEGTLRLCAGEEGADGAYTKKSDGTVIFNPGVWTEAVDQSKWGWNNGGPGIVVPEIAEQLVSADADKEGSRIKAYYEIYQGTTPTNMQIFPNTARAYLSSDELNEIDKINSTVKTVLQSSTLKWIKGTADIDADWDTFQNQLVSIGLNRKLELEQKAWDAYIASVGK